MRITFAYVLAALQAVSAHTLFTTLFINDVNQGDGTCVRMPMSPGNATDPVIGIGDIEMACGNGGNTYVPRACPANSGSKLSFLFRDTPDGSKPGSIDPSHKGPCAVYMKYVETPAVRADGGSWFKIWDDGFDNKTSKWCTERLIDNQGLISVNLPNTLADGYYLVRTEILALHEADKTPPDPQFYVGCAQIYLGLPNAANGVLPKKTVSIPGYLRADDPSVNFNIYKGSSPYIMPGPPPFTNSDPVNVVPRVVHNQSFLPNGVIYTNANWWAVDLDSYSTSDGCWNASTSCFNQTTICYKTAPPTGSQGCKVWEAKCNVIQAACNASNFSGPPDAFKALTRPSQVNHAIPAPSNLTDQYYASKYGPRHVSGFINSSRAATNGTSPPLAVPTLNVAPNLTASGLVSTASLSSISPSSSLHFLSPLVGVLTQLNSLTSTTSLSITTRSTSSSSLPEPKTFTSIPSSKGPIGPSLNPMIVQGSSASTSSPILSTVFRTTLVTSTLGLPFVPPPTSSTLVSSSPLVAASTGSSSSVSSSTGSSSSGSISNSSASVGSSTSASSSNSPLTTSSSPITTSPTFMPSISSSSNRPSTTSSPPTTASATSAQMTSSSSSSSVSAFIPPPTTSATSTLSISVSISSTDTVLEITILPNENYSQTSTVPPISSSGNPPLIPAFSTAITASISIKTSTAPTPSSTYPISTNGKCGAGPNGTGGTTCLGSKYGQCCSANDGTCGATKAHCHDHCQTPFGMCVDKEDGPNTAIITNALPTASPSASSRKRSRKEGLEHLTARHVEYVGKLKRGRHHWMRRLL